MSIKNIQLNTGISIHDYPEAPLERYITIHIDNKITSHWCLSLMLLSSGHLKAVRLIADKEKPIQFSISSKKSGRGKVSWERSEIKITLTRRELTGFIEWFTYYYINSIMPVDHIDNELDGLASDDKRATLTFYVSHALPPAEASDETINNIDALFGRT